jgi:ribosomal protein S18 acetylase RimI-like enzyme
MRIRELRAADAPRVLEFIQRDFPEEEALMGTRPEGFQRLVHRIFRWDTRFLLGLLRLTGRPVFNYFVIEEDGRIVASTLLSYPGPTGYISMVVVDPAYRRRGFAQALLEHARLTARKAKKKFVALDVLAKNAPAIALYERLGYRRLRTAAFMLHDGGASASPPTAPAAPSLRPYRPSDAAALVGIVRARNPPDVEKVLPTRKSEIGGSRLLERAMEMSIGTWVIDRGRGAEGWVTVSVSPLTDAANISNPIVGATVEPELAAGLVRTAVEWCAAHQRNRILGVVTEENVRGRAALEAGGFHEALGAYTLYRPID